MDERKRRRIEWSKKQEKKPSMKRRCDEHDYTQRGIYMITIATEGRLPLFGTLKGDPLATTGNDKPHIVLSPLGERVKACWLDIPAHYPEVSVIKLCIMPDHIHGVLFVKESMPHHLGTIINGFKSGTRKAARELGVITAKATATATVSPSTQPALVRYTEASPQSPLPQSPLPQSPPPQSPLPQSATPHPHHALGVLWEQGYNDRILLQEGQLQRMLNYLDDNPRRLLLKQAHPQYFKPLGKLTIAGQDMEAMGNTALFDHPVKLQVQCSRHLYPNEIEQRKQHFLNAAQQGAVIVSPCISPGEKQIATAILEARLPLIVLLLKGFPPFFKPQPHYLAACAEGRLLMISPYPWQNEKIENMRQRCLQLNGIAAEISKSCINAPDNV
ncbi:MAG: transposase [Prevotella sp.]|nr:transposase [Prevotella sp.]